MEFRSVTNLEELEKLTGDEKIIVNAGGTAKQIAPENAKFGGGSVTVFKAVRWLDNGGISN